MEFKSPIAIYNKKGPLKKLEKDTVRSALSKTGGNKTKASKVLGVGRATLYRFLEEHPEIKPEYAS